MSNVEMPAEAAVNPDGEFRQCEPDSNWPEEMRYLIRFYVSGKGEKLDACPACGGRERGRWTMLCPFRVRPETLFSISCHPKADDRAGQMHEG